MSVSPCMRCTRVANPRDCDNKDCKVWRSWFVEKWDALRAQPRLEIERKEKVMEGVVIGGVRYAMPHRVKDYLRKDPCDGCVCPRDLCVLPCRVKRDWLQARQDVLI